MATATGDLTTASYFETITGLTLDTDITTATAEAFIAATSDELKRLTGRSFVAATYRERHRLRKASRKLYLNEPPIINVHYLTDYESAMLKVKFTDTATRATVEVEERTSLVLRSTVSGTTTTNTLSFSTYTTLTDLVTAIEALSGWSAERMSTAQEDQDPRRLVAGQTFDALDTWLILYSTDEPDDDYRIVYDPGKLEKTFGHFVPGIDYYILYDGGFGDPTATDAATIAEALPKSLQRLVVDMAYYMYASRTKEWDAQSERLGDYSITYKQDGAITGSDMSWPANIQSRIDFWVRPNRIYGGAQ